MFALFFQNTFELTQIFYAPTPHLSISEGVPTHILSSFLGCLVFNQNVRILFKRSDIESAGILLISPIILFGLVSHSVHHVHLRTHAAAEQITFLHDIFHP